MWFRGLMTSQAIIHYCVTSHLSILIENVVLVVPQEKLSLAIASITLLWAQIKRTSFWVSDDVTMMPQAPRPKLWLGTGSFLLSDA